MAGSVAYVVGRQGLRLTATLPTCCMGPMSDSERNASRTARMVAAYRGRSSEGAEAVCDDPWALALAGEDGLKTADAYERYFPHMQLWLGLRTRFLDDLVVRAIAAGCTQIVLLGAGLDTRAARFGRPGVVFYEVDLPASQSDKRARLAALSGYPIEAATYVACDFERDDFLERLEAEGFRSDVQAVFVWEGVTYYLNEPAVRATALFLPSLSLSRLRLTRFGP